MTVYLDDILVFSESPEQHEQHLRWVFNQLSKNNIFVKQKKCSFGITKMEYLGHIVTPKGVAVDPEKTDAINKCPEPQNVKEI